MAEFEYGDLTRSKEDVLYLIFEFDWWPDPGELEDNIVNILEGMGKVRTETTMAELKNRDRIVVEVSLGGEWIDAVSVDDLRERLLTIPQYRNLYISTESYQVNPSLKNAVFRGV